jgi:hypothetical protein
VATDSYDERDALAEVPEALRERIKDIVGDEPIVGALRADLSLDGKFSEQWIVVTPKRLLCLAPNDSDGWRELPLDGVDELRVEAFVGNAYFFARTNGRQEALARFTHSRRQDFERLVNAFRRFKEGETAELRLDG